MFKKSIKKCVLTHPESGKQMPAEILQQDSLRITVRPDGTSHEVFLVRGDSSIPYRGKFKGQYFTVVTD
jgi:hypothetical protein